MHKFEEPKVVAALDAIKEHIVNLGGTVEAEGKAEVGGRAEHNILQKMPGIDDADREKYNPTKVMDVIEKIKKERDAMLEKKVDDRRI